MESKMLPTLFELSRSGKRAVKFPKAAMHSSAKIPAKLLRRQNPSLPELTELDVVRHFTLASQMNYSVDTQFYPLGSCTMKYNPKANFHWALHPAFAGAHPLWPSWAVQGTLESLAGLEEGLAAITGMDAVTLAPAAGAHAELVGILVAGAFYQDKGQAAKRRKIIIPDSAHGTNPASAALGGFEVVTIKSTARGRIDVLQLKKVLDDTTAMVMITVPNTLGLFEDDVLEVSRLAHNAGAQMYMDGANMNALMGIVKPASLGFDMMHINLHKTFSVPHGGGGPGAGVLLVRRHLEEYLPVPRLIRRPANQNGELSILDAHPKSIGRIRAFHGSTGNLLWAASYLALLGRDGVFQASRDAIVNANYLRRLLQDAGLTPYSDEPCMHEAVFTIDPKKLNGVRTLDIAKRLLDFGFYAPTVYFPLIVPEAMMVEPTETESPETLEQFANAVKTILSEAASDPQKVKDAPHALPVRRLDDVLAARNPVVTYQVS
ncbi:MAG: aminomethyl-transferring glycine dehydrogenase subunit GcvPB [Elusimicrobia bacterium]|nr:aminomethyl-transferring glycine dehydrogenase subunit GcvPB [Elusimicrobiota bacterium]